MKLSRRDQEQEVEMQLLNVEVDEWEIAVDRLVLQEVVGRGAFGAVWKALLSEPDGKPGNRPVAAKCFTRKIMTVQMYYRSSKTNRDMCNSIL